MKMENNTHVHSKTTSGKKIVLCLLWVQNTSVFCFVFYTHEYLFTVFIPGCSFFTIYYVHQSWVEGSREGVLHEDQSVTFQLQG